MGPVVSYFFPGRAVVTPMPTPTPVNKKQFACCMCGDRTRLSTLLGCGARVCNTCVYRNGPCYSCGAAVIGINYHLERPELECDLCSSPTCWQTPLGSPRCQICQKEIADALSGADSDDGVMMCEAAAANDDTETVSPLFDAAMSMRPVSSLAPSLYISSSSSSSSSPSPSSVVATASATGAIAKGGPVDLTKLTTKEDIALPKEPGPNCTATEKALYDFVCRDECVACTANKARVILLPCKHVPYCISCTVKVTSQATPFTCPICRTAVKDIDLLYL